MIRRNLCNNWAIWICASLVIVTSSLCAWSDSEQVPHHDGWDYPRHDEEHVRREVDDIFSSSRFQPKDTWWKRFMAWLTETLFQTNAEKSGWAKTFYWIVIIWCSLTLLAILIHFIWVIVTALRGRFHGWLPSFRKSQVTRSVPLDDAHYRQTMLRLQAEGRYPEAIGMMMNYLLQQLSRADILTLGSGKTNGDYMLDYPADKPGWREFCSFATRFDGLIYSGMKCTERDFRSMWDMASQVQNHAENQQ